MHHTLLVPRLLDALRPTLHDVADWCHASYASARAWREGTWGPSPERRQKLIEGVRRHAHELLVLVEAVERETASAPTDGGTGRRRAAGGRADISPKVRRAATRRATKKGRVP